MAANRELQFFIVFSLVIFGIIIVPVYAAKVIETTKEVDVKKELLAKTLSDLRNYKELFPDFVKSVELKQDPNYAKFTINAQGSTYVGDVKSSNQPDSTFVIEVLSGGIKGTKMITTLSERVSFDGKTPDGATTVKTKLILETDFWTSFALLFVGTSQIQKAIGDGFYNVGEYVKVKYPQETINTTPRLEAAKVLEPAKEALKPQITSSQNQQTKSQTSLESTIETQDTKSQTQTNPSIFAKTDKFSYSTGDLIIVFGTVNELQKNKAVSIIITTSNGEILAVGQTDVSQNGKFAVTFKASPLWKTSGIYTVSVKYGILGYQTTFEFKNKTSDLQTNTQPIVIWTENLKSGSTIIELKGLSNTATSIPITISVTNPSGNIVAIDRISTSQDGSFATQIKTGGPLWKQDGFYIIKAQQGDSANTNKIAKIEVYIANGVPSFARSADIIVSTDKESYSDGEVVMVSGQVSEMLDVPVSLRVIAPNGHIIVIEQVDVKSDKTFSAEISAGGNLWKDAGTYTIEVSYGTTSQNTATATTTFEFKNRIETQDSSSIFVKTDRSSYDHNSVINVQGKVANNIRSGADITIRVTGPNGDIVTVDQVKVNSDGTFQTTFSTSGILWKLDGTYVIKATYGPQEINNKVLVELTGGTPSVPKVTTCNAGELNASGHCIPYSISGAMITSAKLSIGTTSLIIQLDANNDGGMISLDLPRSVIDSKFNGKDDSFFVLVDNKEHYFDETKTSTDRTLTIVFEKSAKKIEVIGTYLDS